MMSRKTTAHSFYLLIIPQHNSFFNIIIHILTKNPFCRLEPTERIKILHISRCDNVGVGTANALDKYLTALYRGNGGELMELVHYFENLAFWHRLVGSHCKHRMYAALDPDRAGYGAHRCADLGFAVFRTFYTVVSANREIAFVNSQMTRYKGQ